MSHSSAPDGPAVGETSDERGVVEPTAALVAAVAVCLGVSLYAGVLVDAIPAVDRNAAEPTLERVQETLTGGGVLHPDRLPLARDRGPAGYDLNVTVAVAERRWRLGPPVPGGNDDPRSSGYARPVDRARCRPSVVVAPGVVRRGSLEVAVWS